MIFSLEKGGFTVSQHFLLLICKDVDHSYLDVLP